MMSRLPDVSQMSTHEAAFVYAEAGVPVVPFDPKQGKGKSCGNLVGGDQPWHEQVTTDADQLRAWIEKFGPFQALATSPGMIRSNGSRWCVLDIDRPNKFPRAWRRACENTVYVNSRPKEHRRRGHYFFRLPAELPPIGNPAFEWGEVRCFGGGIVLPPYPLDNRYVVRAGEPDLLPTSLLALIAGAGAVGASTDLESFCTTYTGNKYPHKLKGLLGLHAKKLASNPNNPHGAMLEALRVGFGESVIGFIPARTVLDTLLERWDRSLREFYSLARWCASVAQQADPDDLTLKSTRTSGSDSRVYADHFRQQTK